MLDALSDRLQGTFQRLGNKGRIGETELDEALREVRIALLEADVNFKVVRDLVARVRERSLGQEVLKSITPAQQIIGIVNDELVETLGKQNAPLLRPEAGPLKIMVVGTKGGGKTTLAGRLALKFKNEGMKPLLISTDFERVAASEQLQVLGRSIGVETYVEETEAPAGNGSAAVRRPRDADPGSEIHLIDTRLGEVDQTGDAQTGQLLLSLQTLRNFCVLVAEAQFYVQPTEPDRILNEGEEGRPVSNVGSRTECALSCRIRREVEEKPFEAGICHAARGCREVLRN